MVKTYDDFSRFEREWKKGKRVVKEGAKVKCDLPLTVYEGFPRFKNKYGRASFQLWDLRVEHGRVKLPAALGGWVKYRQPGYIPLDGVKYNTPRVVSVNRAEYVTVTQCRSGMPDAIGGIVWLAFGAQDTSCFMPFYNGITEIPRSFEIGDHWHFDRKSARWAFDYVDYHTQPLYSLAIEDVREAQKQFELAAVERTYLIDKAAMELYKEDPAKAIEFLNHYCINNANAVINEWWELGDQLLVKYNHLWIYEAKTRKRLPLKFPDWYLKELIKYNKLVPEEKK